MSTQNTRLTHNFLWALHPYGADIIKRGVIDANAGRAQRNNKQKHKKKSSRDIKKAFLCCFDFTTTVIDSASSRALEPLCVELRISVLNVWVAAGLTPLLSRFSTAPVLGVALGVDFLLWWVRWGWCVTRVC